jgi:diguanylate cyclase (GGDEF)-like protein
MWSVVLWIALADPERRVGAGIAALALLLAGSALHAWLRQSGLLAAFAAWTASLSLCAAASGWDLAWLAGPTSANGGTTLRLAAYTAHLATTISLLVALFGQDLASPRLRRWIGWVPAAGGIAALVFLALPQPLAPAGLPYAAGLVSVIVLFASLHTMAATHAAQLSVFIVGWAAHAAGAMYESLTPTGSPGSPGSLAAGSGTIVFALAVGGIVARRLRAEARQRDQAERNALDAARKYRHVYYTAPVALISADLLGQILRWNDQAGRLFRTELRQGRVNTLVGVMGAERAGTLIADATTTGRHRSELHVRFDEAEGGMRIFAIDALQAADAIEITLVDITERSLLARTLEHMAYHDALTDRLNRRGLEREIERLTRAVARGEPASLIFVDLDRFKAINDAFGHTAGDTVVTEVANRLAAALPESAHVGRLGGDEFLVAVPDCPLDRARSIAQALARRVIDEPYDVDGKRLRIEAGLGIVEIAADMRVPELIAYADAACAEAKKGRSGRIVAAESSREHLARYRAEIALGARLRSCLPIERMSVHAQPIVALRGDPRVLSYEVLLRERDEHGQMAPPTRLIAAAERHGAMGAIDRFMLESTLQHLDRHRRHAGALGFVTVNLSGTSLNDDRFLADVHSMLSQHSAVASRVCLEITESVALYDIRNTRRFVDRMHSLGVRIALDDFGAGYSSFAYLRELPAALIKIDGQFTLGIDRHPKNQVIVRSIGRLAEELGMACLAEWVEDCAALETLLALGLDYAQGFVFSKAQPIEAWLTQAVDLQPLEQARRRASGDAATGRPRRMRSAVEDERTPVVPG